MNLAATYHLEPARFFCAYAHREGCEHCECSAQLGDLGEKDVSVPVESFPRPERWRDCSFFRSDKPQDSL